ncbi:DEAD/DEAH box helicase [Lactobacillus reuteri]|uniref:DEAD/DEAH box helicase n=1 Tax=Limosilactobacillus reuteri TaxID=1598 RepID=A0A7X2KIP8_LIMRT|nr:DEAD/DEAH box helicase family protein [Limosilactobacillus reuteri]MRH71972.1 DEAD/DEAH box helicase [Limosilactobacillus reuteri]MRH80283.1 DEAD/DEAH box helicase [Limosilactobacillus reuteri]
MNKKTTHLAPLDLLDSIHNAGGFVLDPVRFELDKYNYIWDNLKHTLRNYQLNAVANFHYGLNYAKWDWKFGDTKPKHDLIDQRTFMFWMATGSGKTDIMAALILYLYKEKGMQNFVFTTSLTSVLLKTKDNFLKPTSTKYLFQPNIWIDGQKITINAVQTLPKHPQPNTINLLVTNIDRLNNVISQNTTKESIGLGLSKLDFNDNRYVILADEAHHFNALTKGKGGAYEHTLDELRRIGAETYQLEFTATLSGMDGHSNIYQKYRDKVIARFDLGEFSHAGYSKRVTQIASNLDDNTKMIQGILMNVARQLIAKDNQINYFKPIILFKSYTKTRNKVVYNHFLKLIQELTVDQLQRAMLEIEQKNQEIALVQVAIQRLKAINPLKLLTMIQQEFTVGAAGNVNDEKDAEFLNQLNTLESPNSPYRVVFAVEKLTEGWDVLNLFDIVKLDDSQVSKEATNREAQLVGRGARYYPFVVGNEAQLNYQRRYDKDDLSRQLLETLFFHTIRQDKYIDNLAQAYQAIGLNVQINTNSSEHFTARLKKNVISLPIWQNGVVFENQLRATTAEDYQTLADFGVKFRFSYDARNLALGNEIYEDDIQQDEEFTTKEIELSSKLFLHASYRLEFYRFDRLHQYLPKLKSLQDFFNHYLKKVVVEVKVDDDETELSINDQLKIATSYLIALQKKIQGNYLKEIGTAIFHPIKIKERFVSYERNLPKPVTAKDPRYSAPVRKGLWFPFDRSIGDEEEQIFITMIQDSKDTIQKIIGPNRTFMLLRNDEKAHHLTLHEIHGIRNYMPDFVLLINGYHAETVQFYLEPKGEHLDKQDKWKQDLLKSIHEKAQVVGYSGKTRLYGLPFFHRKETVLFKDRLLNKLNDIFQAHKYL